MARAAVQSNVLAAQQKALDAGSLDLPVGQTPQGQPQVVDTPPQSSAGWLAELNIQESAAAPDEMAIDPGMAAEVERQAIPAITSPERMGGQRAPDEWLTPAASMPTPERELPVVSSMKSDGGMIDRAEIMAKNAVDRTIDFSVREQPTPEVGETNLSNILHRAGAVAPRADGKAGPDPLFMSIGSLVTENTFAELTIDPTVEETDALTAAIGEEQQQRPQTTEVKRATNNAQIGNQIYQEYQRAKGVTVPEKSLGKEQAEVLGATFKDMWAKNNPDLVKGVVDPESGQMTYQLTSTGQTLLENGAAERKLLFPKKNVQPSKQPLPKGKLPGDTGRTVVKQVSGRVGKQEFGKVLNDAAKNLATVPNVVDTQRTKIMYQTLLPVLQSGDHTSWMAEIHSIGPDKLSDFEAAAGEAARKTEEAVAQGKTPPKAYDAAANMRRLTNKLAQEVRAIAQNRKGANYLTYNLQAFNGRLTPQQTAFNPTTSKAVRFVTRNAVPTKVVMGGKREKALRQMYTLLLNDKISGSPMNGADLLLPEARDRALQQASAKLERWGNEVANAITMTDEQYEAVSEAITQGVALDDPNFPQFQPMQLQDPDLIKTVMKKGEDGPHYLDALVDFAKYQQAKRAGRPHMTTLNAYIDGKTNGLASNGIQMGSYETAQATGVVRSQTTDLLDAGDVRDALALEATALIDKGWDGDTHEFEVELNEVAREVFNTRSLNKATTMTFGYGKEISSFGQDISKTIDRLAVDKPDFAANLEITLRKSGMNQDQLSQMLLGKYREALEGVLSDDAIDTRRLMRGSAALHSAMNELMTIKTYTGMDLALGGTERTGEAESTRVGLYTPEGKTSLNVQHYGSEVTSAAARNRTDAEGNTVSLPGDYAYGGSLPGPVQSLDAATVAMTASGKSWEKLKAASHGNPYIHTIYDAFKMDVAGYDTMLEEVNNNWLEATMNWSYLEQTRDATKNAFKKWREKNAGRPTNDPLSRTEALYMNSMMETNDDGQLQNYISKLRNIVRLPKDRKEANKIVFGLAADMKREMQRVGYNASEPTWIHQKTFVETLNKHTKLGGQFDAAIDRTNRNKRELKKRIDREGPVYQYYAH